MLSEAQLLELQSQRKYFIENGAEASLFQWLTSKGTNFTCYVEYLNSLDREQDLNNKIEIIRTIIYALHKPIQFTFFYWTLLIFILHKFNFKKPVMKILLAHFVLRTLGDIIDKFGGLFSHYFANVPITDSDGNITGYTCQYASPNTEMHPLKWFLTRQIGCIFWCCGEIVADWYPLIRTKAVAREQKSLKLVYITCGCFNLSKIALILYHYFLSPKELYDKNGVYDKSKIDLFYFTYWIIQLIIIYASVIYDYSVYYVIRKSFTELTYSKYSFLNKFKSISEFRILVSAVVCVIFLPIISLTIIAKYYFYYRYGYHNLEFSFDEIRQSINNVQYFMIFIDQILLIRSQGTSSTQSSNNFSSSIHTSHSMTKLKFSNIINNSNNTLTNSNQNYLLEYSYLSGNLNKSNNPLSPVTPNTPNSPVTPITPASTLVNNSFAFKNISYSTLPNTSTIVNNSILYNSNNNFNGTNLDELRRKDQNNNRKGSTTSSRNIGNGSGTINNNTKMTINTNISNFNSTGNLNSGCSSSSSSNFNNVGNIVSPNFGMLSSYYNNDKFEFK